MRRRDSTLIIAPFGHIDVHGLLELQWLVLGAFDVVRHKGFYLKIEGLCAGPKFKENEFSAQFLLYSNISSFCSEDIVRKRKEKCKAVSEPIRRPVSNNHDKVG